MKYMDGNDTFKADFYCHFKKLLDDTLYSSAFHYYTYINDTIKYEVMYTGEDFVTASSRDSVATVMSNKIWAKEIKSYAHNYKFYSPLFSKKWSPISPDTSANKYDQVILLPGEESVNGHNCYHIQLNEVPQNDPEDMMKTLRQEYHYWIKKSDLMVVQYTIAYELVMNNDTMYQFEKNVLKKYEINHIKNDKLFSLSAIPSYYTFKDYTPYKSPDLLKLDTIAPDWELWSLTDEKVRLKDLQGQLVLVDFFYKSCYPCMLALPSLQALHEKYQSQGLRIVGIDPYDTKEDNIATFLAKRGVTYTVLLGGKEVAKEYRVSGYPTLYLIDRTGKVVFVQVGFGKNTEHELEEIIQKHL